MVGQAALRTETSTATRFVVRGRPRPRLRFLTVPARQPGERGLSTSWS